jgi:hypothetical protein
VSHCNQLKNLLFADEELDLIPAVFEQSGAEVQHQLMLRLKLVGKALLDYLR